MQITTLQDFKRKITLGRKKGCLKNMTAKVIIKKEPEINVKDICNLKLENMQDLWTNRIS